MQSRKSLTHSRANVAAWSTHTHTWQLILWRENFIRSRWRRRTTHACEQIETKQSILCVPFEVILIKRLTPTVAPNPSRKVENHQKHTHIDSSNYCVLGTRTEGTYVRFAEWMDGCENDKFFSVRRDFILIWHFIWFSWAFHVSFARLHKLPPFMSRGDVKCIEYQTKP